MVWIIRYLVVIGICWVCVTVSGFSVVDHHHLRRSTSTGWSRQDYYGCRDCVNHHGRGRWLYSQKDESSSSKSSSSSSNRRVKPIPYIATVSTVEHGRALQQFLKPTDRVLELGTQLDDTTQFICEQAASTILVDVSRTETKSGRSMQGSRRENPSSLFSQKNHVTYMELDQFSDWQSLDLPELDVLIMDTSAMLGNDLIFQTMSIISTFVQQQQKHHQQKHQHRPRCIICKSKSLSSLARRLIHAQRLLDGTTTTMQGNFTTHTIHDDGKPYIVASVGVEEYRRTIPYMVQPGDECLEVGCFKGTTTALLHHQAVSDDGYCIGVDIGPKIINRARLELPNITFEVGDAWKTLDLLRMKQKKKQQQPPRKTKEEDVLSGYDVVYADIGGLSGPDGVLDSLALLDGLGYALEPRCIVIKSLCMKRLASSLRPYSHIWEQKQKQKQNNSSQ